MDVYEIGNRIKKARALRNYTLDDIANEIGVTKSTIQRYENGLIAKPKIPVLQAIANSLKVNPAWLSGKDVPMEIETFEEKWDREVKNFFDKINAFEIQLRSLGWNYESKGCHTAKCAEFTLSLDDNGNFSETENSHPVGCDEKKCENCSENESYYLFSNGEISFKVSIEDYSAFINDAETFYKERLQNLLRKSMKQMFVDTAIDNKVYLEPQAAHERTDIETSAEAHKRDDDIMGNDDNWK